MFIYSFIQAAIPPSPQSIILMVQCVTVYLYVLMQIGIVLYACIFNLFKCCVMDLILCLTFFTSSALRLSC